MSHPLRQKIRNLSASELSIPLSWAAAEGWNPGLNDAGAFYAADPSGFFIGEIDGQPVSAISAVRYNSSFGFIGLYIVRPEWRGKGFGKQIFDHALKYLRPCNIGLDGVLAQVGNYDKSGFKTAYRNIRFELKGGNGKKSPEVEMLDLSHIAPINAFDRTCFPVPREDFLRRWIALPEHRCFGFYEHHNLGGYAVVRPCATGFKIGPLFARELRGARALLETILIQFVDQSVFLDPPEPNTAAVRLAESLGGKRVFETARMYSGSIPAVDMNRIFGITTFELG